MAIILTLCDRETHVGITLVHHTSEHVVLGNVFGIVKNLPYDAVLNPWPVFDLESFCTLVTFDL